MTQLKTLGELRLEPIPFRQAKPLLLLAYLVIEGSQLRRHLAQLFWPNGDTMNRLAVTLSRLRKGAGKVVEADDRRAWVAIESDVKALLSALDKSQWQAASDLYKGAFLDGVVLDDLSRELEEWVYATREYLAERVQYALIHLAEEAARTQDFHQAGKLAERAYRLPGLGGTEVEGLKRIYPLLCAGNSLLAPEVRKELESFSIHVQLTTDDARASFRQVTNSTAIPIRHTYFIGRDQELTELANLVHKPHVSLITLLGPAGVGKTRLAMQFAHDQQRSKVFKDGVDFLALENVGDGHVLSTLLMHFGLPQRDTSPTLEQLIRFMSDKHMLLILDNVEHLSSITTLLSQIMQQCPELRFVVTSRERLNLEQEYLFTLGGLACPLALPQAEASQREAAKLAEAIQLFNHRALQVSSFFDLDEHLSDVVQICQMMEGLPLGIELAASWVRVMSCKDIILELERWLDLLTSDSKNIPERHRSLRAAFDYSWQRLKSKEQEVLRKLSVFVGGFRREAASKVAGATIPLLASLVDKSLLRATPDGRYVQHPLLRYFSLEKLANDPLEQAQTVEKHRAHILELAAEFSAQRNTRLLQGWLWSIDEELDNIRGTLKYLLKQSDGVLGLTLVTALDTFWASRGLHQEVASYLSSFLSNLNGQSPNLQAKGLNLLAYQLMQMNQLEAAKDCLEQALLIATSGPEVDHLPQTLNFLGRIHHFHLSDKEAAAAFYQQSIALSEKSGQTSLTASSFNFLAILESEQGNFERAQHHYQQSLNLWNTLGHKSGAAWVLNNMASISDYRGDYAQAEFLFSQSLGHFRDLGEKNGLATTLANLGTNALKQQDYTKVKPLLKESLELAQSLGDKRLEAFILRGLGQMAFRESNYETAQHLFQQSYRLYEQVGYTHGEVETLGHLGETLHQKGNLMLAEDYFQKGLSMARTSNDLAAVSSLALLYALLNLELGKYDDARQLLSESAFGAEHVKSPETKMCILEGFARLETELRHPQKAATLWGCCNTMRQQLGRKREALEQNHYETSVVILQQYLSPERLEGMLYSRQSVRVDELLKVVLAASPSVEYIAKQNQ